ncbi:MAG: T9SS type A sorting domain-containing protein, partial [Flavobacteriales bacterium]|nr:T9SS type A sorting domain-containing protein [Flavobacteriales bacterium]
ACIAECLGFELADCGDVFNPGDGEDPFGLDCDCPEPTNEEFVCVADEMGNVFEFPSACIAECLGFELADCGDVFNPGDGEDPLGLDCDCPEPTFEDFVCVADEMGNVFEFPSACIAECLGFELADCGNVFNPGDGEDPFGLDCDCPEPTFEEYVCVADEMGNIFEFPSACIAECLGLSVVEDCGDVFNPGDGEDPFGLDCDCPEPIEDTLVCATDGNGITLVLPSACIAECLGFTVIEDCDFENDGFTPPGVDLDLDQMFEDFTSELFGDLLLYPNPTENLLNLQINLAYDDIVNLELYSLTGQVVYDLQLNLMAGQQTLDLDLSEIPAGSYILQLSNKNGERQTQQVVKTK